MEIGEQSQNFQCNIGNNITLKIGKSELSHCLFEHPCSWELRSHLTSRYHGYDFVLYNLPF